MKRTRPKLLDASPQVDAFMQRLKTFMTKKELSMHAFGTRSDIAAGGVSRAINAKGTYNLGIDKVYNILMAFPQLNPIWLLFGYGEMEEAVSPETMKERLGILQAENEQLQKDLVAANARCDAYQEAIGMLAQAQSDQSAPKQATEVLPEHS